ncbi:uncharacterized protein TNCV_3401481 [Trichonephila clavipes]|nr:uncharacterized protein TNCV_3401481 [Trichonephila clavipes]
MACDAEDCGFQMLNDDEIVTSVQEESDPVDDETDEDGDINNESSKGPLNADAFYALDTYGVVRTTIRVLSYSTIGAQENQILQRKRRRDVEVWRVESYLKFRPLTRNEAPHQSLRVAYKCEGGQSSFIGSVLPQKYPPTCPLFQYFETDLLIPVFRDEPNMLPKCQRMA